MAGTHQARNQLLGKMTSEDPARVLAGSIEVELVKGQQLAVPGAPLVHGWFPLSGMVSMIAVNSDGHEAEIGLIGFDGFVSSAAILGGERHSLRMLVQIPGTALRIDAAVLRQAMRESSDLSRLMLAYVEAFSVQVASSALAYARLRIEQRLARWLLMCADRVGDDAIALTHDALAIMLGVRRAGVTTAIGSLEAMGCITVTRGRQIVRSRDLLLKVAGAGYGDAEAEAQRILAQLDAGSATRPVGRSNGHDGGSSTSGQPTG